MSFSINEVFLVGNVSNSPELKYTPNGNAVLNFNMATNRSIKNGDNWDNAATFHRIVVWGKIAEWLSKNLYKGNQVVVRGRIDNRSYEKKDGSTAYISEVVANDVIPQKQDRSYADEAEEAFTNPPRSAVKQTEPEPPEDMTSEDDIDLDEIPY